jgi:GNAT superfamily N-acetyltransferase
MSYVQRLATTDDISAIAPLWRAFTEARSQADPTLMLKPDFDYEQYVGMLLAKPSSYCFVSEYLSDDGDRSIIGFLLAYIYDENPRPNLPPELTTLEKPFKPRLVSSVVGLYVQEKHRHLDTIKQLVNAALTKAEELKITDIDILISAQETGIHALLERAGFTKAMVQYVKHYQ